MVVHSIIPFTGSIPVHSAILLTAKRGRKIMVILGQDAKCMEVKFGKGKAYIFKDNPLALHYGHGGKQFSNQEEMDDFINKQNS